MPPTVSNTVLAARASAREQPWSRGAPLTFADDEEHALYQKRLGLACGVLAVIIVGFFIVEFAFVAIMIGSRYFAEEGVTPMLINVASLALLSAGHVVCRGKLRPPRLLAGVDLGVTLGVMAVVAFGVAGGNPWSQAELTAVAAFLLLFVLRAAIVPSAPRWTLFVSLASALLLPVAAYVGASRVPHEQGELVAPALAAVVRTTAWCAGGVTACTAVSRVIYGLRTQVKNAVRLGQYTLEEKIGEGGMGAVYRARHALLRRPTAIKLLAEGRAGEASVRRFEREVQITSSLKHPNTVAIYDFGRTREGVFYYAMELLDGVSLEDLVQEDGPQPPGRVVHVLSQIAGALAEAHRAGVIHRDVKPANILLCERGGVYDFGKVLDFGLVKAVGVTDPELSSERMIVGTPHYMAPESFLRATELDARADLYALGAVAYFLLTGQVVFEGANLVHVCSKHVHEPPVPPSERLGGPVPRRLEALVLRCLAKEPAERPASAEAIVAELRACAEESPWSEGDARRWWQARAERMSAVGRA